MPLSADTAGPVVLSSGGGAKEEVRESSPLGAMTRRFTWPSSVGRGGIEPPTFRFQGGTTGVQDAIDIDSTNEPGCAPP
jgi:hypothetical protein